MIRVFARNLVTASQLPKLRVAIVGTGPAGFYTGHHLLNKGSSKFNLKVDFFERLPAPYGLSRYGVAPDHPEVKNCQDVMDELLSKESVRFFGNVIVGQDLSLTQLAQSYHSVVLAYGCTAEDAKLAITVPDLARDQVVSARQFVNWYNGHPSAYAADGSENSDIDFHLDQVENVTIIGNGNVALDVARVLLANPASHWQPTDIASTAVNALKNSTVKQVKIVARRGLLQSAFSNKEMRELLEMSESQGIRFVPLDNQILEKAKEHKLPRILNRKVQLLEKHCAKSQPAQPAKEWALDFLKSPSRFICDGKGRLTGSEFVVNTLVEDPVSGKTRVEPTLESVLMKNELVITSIGYLGKAMDEFKDLGIIFEKNKIVNKVGRILRSDHLPLVGWYVSGWIKSGPQGVIATTMMNAFETADCILEDFGNGIHLQPPQEFDASKLTKPAITWSQWNAVDQYEIKEGKKQGKSREKVRSVDQMIDVASR